MSEQKMPVATGAPGNAPQKMVTELKVSGNLMTLDAGLFCIFNAPGSALPDAGSGLPGVRISLPPGPAFRPDAITITSFRDDGWLGGWNGAALVRVTRGPAQVLVTIYQAPNSPAEAPRLQILRLAESGALPPLGTPQGAKPPPAPAVLPGQMPAAKPAAAPMGRAGPVAATPPRDSPAGGQQTDPSAAGAEIVAHIQGRGDVATRLGEWMGEPDSKRWVEGFAIAPRGAVGPNDVEYQAVLGRGWLSPWAEGGQYCGSRGMSLPILGLRMRLRGEAAERFDCVVTASFVDGTKVGPLDNGEPCQAESMSPLESFRIEVLARAPVKDIAPKSRSRLPSGKAKAPPEPVKVPARPVAAPPVSATSLPVPATAAVRLPMKPNVKPNLKPTVKPAIGVTGKAPKAVAEPRYPAAVAAAKPGKAPPRSRR